MVWQMERQPSDKVPHDSGHLPAMRGKTETDTLACLEAVAVPTYTNLVGDKHQSFTYGFGYLLRRPSRIARSAEIENHNLILIFFCKGNEKP
jgi:hypothetical protein